MTSEDEGENSDGGGSGLGIANGATGQGQEPPTASALAIGSLVIAVAADLPELNPAEVGVLICGHGSRNRLAVEEFARLAEGLRPRMGGLPVEHGYLEFAKPTCGTRSIVFVRKE